MIEYLPHWADTFLITPYRIADMPLLGMWVGTALLALYATLLGEVAASLLFLFHQKRFKKMQQEMIQAHNTSVAALHAHDKESYLAINAMAHDKFGKFFFSQATLSIASLWPAPFALAWMASRFEGVHIFSLPGSDRPLSYPFIFILSYILIRILFSYTKKYLPFFKGIVRMQEENKSAAGVMKAMFPSKKVSLSDATLPQGPGKQTEQESENKSAE